MPPRIERWLRIHEVFHPTDCTPESDVALLHALKVALATEARLTLMRVSPDNAPVDDFPDVRRLLERWKYPAPRDRLLDELPIRWRLAQGPNPVDSCLKSLQRTPADLIVVATGQCGGKVTWLGKSVAEPLARSAGEMTLLVPQETEGFVRRQDGAVTLKSILISIASEPSSQPAIEAARRLVLHLPETAGTVTLLHVATRAEMPPVALPDLPSWRWNHVVKPGQVVDTILETAAEMSADLLVMTTQGRHGFLDALRGSTTEQVLRQARCPMLTMPVGSFLG